MGRESELACGSEDAGELLQGPDPPTCASVRLLEHDDARGLQPVGGLGHGSHLLGRDPAGGAGEAARDQPRVHGGTARFEDQDVRAFLRDELAPGPRLDAERDLVRHRRRWQKERRLLAEQRRRAPLELVDRRILAFLFVADLGGSHGGEHLDRRLGRGVGAEIDHEPQPTGVALELEPRPTLSPALGWGSKSRRPRGQR